MQKWGGVVLSVDCSVAPPSFRNLHKHRKTDISKAKCFFSLNVENVRNIFKMLTRVLLFVFA